MISLFADSEQPSSLQNSILSVDSSVSINDRPDSPEGIDSSLEDNTPTLPASVVKERRNLLNSKLAGHKQEKLKRKIPNDNQLLTCAQEELKLKKQMLESMEASDKECSENMNKMFCNIERLTNSIADGFALMRQVMVPQPSYAAPQHYFHQSQPSAFQHQGQNVGSAGMSAATANVIDRQSSGQFSFTDSLFSDEHF